MRVLWCVLIPLFALVACDGPPRTTGRIERQTLSAAAIGATYEIVVRLPPGYDTHPEARFPVVYQLDALFLGEMDVTTGHASQLEAAGEIPEVIVVGIGHQAETEDPRMRDFVPPSTTGEGGHADAFHAFLEAEVVPAIDLQYRTDPSARVLVGHSLGGLFALYAFTRAEPGVAPLFRHVVAADASYGSDHASIFAEEQALAARTRDRPGSIYLTAALYSGAAQSLYFDTMSERLARYGELRVGHALLDTDHGGAIGPSVHAGLRFALGDVR